MLTDHGTDFRLAVRTLAKARGFTIVAIVTLALGIALNTSVLAVVNAYLLKTLPYPGAGRLYNIVYAPPGQPRPQGLEALPWDRLGDVIEHGIAWDLDMFYLMGGEHPESAPGAWVTPGFMDGLGIRPAIGRSFSRQDYQAGSPQVALISHSLWRKRYGGDQQILGQRFQAYVSDRPDEAEEFTIIGVMPEHFWHVNPYTEVLAPLRAVSYPYMARLRPGIPPTAAEGILAKFIREGAVQVPENWKPQLRSTHDVYVASVRPLLAAVTGAAGLVLLIACVNVAFLMMIRAARRQKEIAVRMALGAGRTRVARMLIVEALVLASAATAAGVGLSALLIQWVAPIVQRQLGRPAPGGAAAISIDASVLGIAGAFGLITTVLFAMAPLALSWRTGLAEAMHHGRRSGMEGRGNRRLRAGLIVLEIAGSLSLLAGCGLMIRTVMGILEVDLGYKAQNVLTGNTGLRQRSYPDAAAQAAFYNSLMPRLARIPGVVSAGSATSLVLHQPRRIPVKADIAGRQVAMETAVLSVTPEYFSAVGIPVIAGRPFRETDLFGGEPVALVSEALARRLWGSESSIGSRIQSSGQWRTVVGVVRDVRQSHSDDDPSDLYLPMSQSPGRFAWLYVRTAGPPASWLRPVLDTLKEVDSSIALNRPNALSEILDEQISRPLFLAGLLAAFAALAVMLALLGVYGVIAYGVSQREHEIAVRMALGADASSVTGLFLRQGAWLLAFGITAGWLSRSLLAGCSNRSFSVCAPPIPLFYRLPRRLFRPPRLPPFGFPREGRLERSPQ